MNIRTDVIWALRGQGGGQTVHEINMRIVQYRNAKYAESKIQAVLDVLAQAGSVTKSENTGRVLYTWTAPSQ